MRLVDTMRVSILAGLAACAAAPAAAPDPALARVRDCSPDDIVPARGTVINGAATAVIDGDSFCVGASEIRLQDLDAPEWDQTGGPEARDALADILISAGTVSCDVRARSYDRAIGACRLPDGSALGDRLRAGKGDQ